MRILVTNDDGIDSIGLHVLARALKPLGEIVVVAPDREYSGASASVGPIPLTTEKHKAHIEGIDEAWAVSGPPGLIVLLATIGAFGPPFDLVVSGVNPGANAGCPVYLSGTVGAAVMARIRGITGVAVSIASKESQLGQTLKEEIHTQKWESAAEIAAIVVSSLVENPLPEPAVLNINVPNMEVSDIKGWIRAEIGSDFARTLPEVTIKPIDGHDDSHYVIMNSGENLPPPAIETDLGAVGRGYVAVTWVSKYQLEDKPFGDSIESSLDALFLDIPGG
jgi:5'-nucleotidase